MNDTRPRGVLESNPNLDHLRVPPSENCWWCGEYAATEEHRFKKSTLRRIGTDDSGRFDARNIFKKSTDYEGALSTIEKGSQIRWRRNLCANCNNARSQRFDGAYERFESFVVQQFDEIPGWDRLSWRDVYGTDWRARSRDLARYFAKQLGCMLSNYDLLVPDELRQFLDGREGCPSISFTLSIDPRVVRLAKEVGDADLSTYIGYRPADSYQDRGDFAGIDFWYYIGYVSVFLIWRRGANSPLWNYCPSVPLPRFPEDSCARGGRVDHW